MKLDNQQTYAIASRIVSELKYAHRQEMLALEVKILKSAEIKKADRLVRELRSAVEGFLKQYPGVDINFGRLNTYKGKLTELVQPSVSVDCSYTRHISVDDVENDIIIRAASEDNASIDELIKSLTTEYLKKTALGVFKK